MGYSIGYTKEHQRYIGYGVHAVCDHPDCNEIIDRGMGYACCDGEQHNGSCHGYFCEHHKENYLYFDELEDLSDDELSEIGECRDKLPLADDSQIYKCNHSIRDGKEACIWINHVLTDDSWAEWRKENSNYVLHYQDLMQKKAGDKNYVLVQKLEQPINNV